MTEDEWKSLKPGDFLARHTNPGHKRMVVSVVPMSGLPCIELEGHRNPKRTVSLFSGERTLFFIAQRHNPESEALSMQAKQIKPPIKFVEEDIQDRIKRLGAVMLKNRVVSKRPIALMPVLKGAFLFASDLLRTLPADSIMCPVVMNSYGDAQTPGTVTMKYFDPPANLNNYDVWIADTILHTGKQLAALTLHLENVAVYRHPIRSVVLIHNTEGNHTLHMPTLVGFKTNGGFLVGYGMDLKQECRGLRYIHEYRQDDPKCPHCGVNQLLYGCWCACERLKQPGA